MSSSARCRQSRRKGREQKGQEVGQREWDVERVTRGPLKETGAISMRSAGGIVRCRRKEQCGGERAAAERGSG